MTQAERVFIDFLRLQGVTCRYEFKSGLVAEFQNGNLVRLWRKT